jgi:hypothetical protein
MRFVFHPHGRGGAGTTRRRFAVDVAPPDFFDAFMDLTMRAVDGALDMTAYEDAMREMFSVEAYRFYTVDKLAQSIVRQVLRWHYTAWAARSFRYCALVGGCFGRVE